MNKLVKDFESKGKAVLDKAKKEYGKMKGKYNEATLDKEATVLLKNAEKELNVLKNKFIEEANKLAEQLVKQAEAEDSNTHIKDDMAYIRKFNELSLKYDVMPLHIILDEFNNIDNEFEFNIAKRRALQLASTEQQRDIYNRFYQNPLYTEVKATKQYIIELQTNNKKFILPFGINDVEEYITGNALNNYYFNGRNIEDLQDYYFGGSK